MQAARGTPIGETSQPDPSDLTARRRRSRVVLAAVAVGGLALDVIAKSLAVAKLDPSDPVVLFGGLLRLQLIRNPGAAFSLGESFTIVFAVLSAVVLGFVLIKLAPRVAHVGWGVALGLLVAGVSGNLSDRVFREPAVLHGHVVDFLQLPHWPIFNVADMCITSAAVLIVVLAIIRNVGLDGTRHGATEQSGTTASKTSETSAASDPAESNTPGPGRTDA